MSLDDWKWLFRKPRFYLLFSLFGLALVGFALLTRGIVDVSALHFMGFAAAFFGTTVIWAANRMIRDRAHRLAEARARLRR
jgi:hypothetical protein